MLAHDRRVQPPPQLRLVAGDALAPRLELLLELGHLHRQQVLGDRPHRRRLEDLMCDGARQRAARNLAWCISFGAKVCVKCISLLLRDPAVKAYKFGILEIPTPTLCFP